MLWIDSMWFESFYLKGHARECERKNSWKNDRVNQYWQWNIITDGFITAHSIHLRAPFYQNSIQYLIYILFYLRLSPYCSWFSLIRISRKLFAKWKMCVCTMHTMVRLRLESKPEREIEARHKRQERDYWAVGNEPLITNELRVKLSIIWCAL